MMWQPPSPPKPAKHRRYRWCRLENGFPDLPLWRAVATRARVPVHMVLAVVVRLESLANRSVPRGSVADMSVPEFAAALQLGPNAVARIRAALEDPDIAWVDQDSIVDFHQRNPDHEDTTAAERKRRQRARLKEQREGTCEGVRPGGARGPPELIHSHGMSRRDTVTVTPDQIRSDSASPALGKKQASGLSENAGGMGGAMIPGAADSPVHSNCGDKGDNLTAAEAAEVWLAVDGKRIVIERLQVNATLAAVRMERWRRELEDDPAALAEVLKAADKADYVGARFHNLVVDQVKRRQHQANGPALPLPPAGVGAGLGRRSGDG